VEEVIVYDKINRSSYYIKEVTCYRGVRVVVFNATFNNISDLFYQ